MENKYAKQRMIKDIQMDDVGVQVVGYVDEISMEDKEIIIDDKNGKLTVDFEDIEGMDLTEGDLINVIGEIKMDVDGKQTLKAEIIQDRNEMNFEYYTQLYEIKKDHLS
ncbi:MAG: OB fold protein [Promethearchaeota archaeon]|nr:MAG: OB fold protein [Candidatus Lokiarchaeota archaeon]